MAERWGEAWRAAYRLVSRRRLPQGVRQFCAARRLKETAFYFWRAEKGKCKSGRIAQVAARAKGRERNGSRP